VDDALLDRIAQDIKKAGFASELSSLQRLASRNWMAFAGYHYLDADEQKERDVDINAVFEMVSGAPERPLHAWFRILAEVKKSEKPWVVLRGPNSSQFIDWHASKGLMGAGYNLVRDFSLTPFELYFDETVAMKNGWIGHGVHESFKPPNEFSRSYVAFGSVCKACEAALAAFNEINVAKTDLAVTLIQPVIILDGPLASVAVDSHGGLVVKAEKWAAIGFSQRSKMLKRGSYLIDVVQLEFLDEFLSMAERRLKSGVDVMKKTGYF
jgi:hypothetical protein